MYPYNVDVNDHAETPIEAFEDICPFLWIISQQSSTPPSSLRLYDPFYCSGAVIKKLSSLGFPNVYNRKEDFYATIAANRTPEFDILITNPPFSSDHIPKTFEFAFTSNRPFFLLLPAWVGKKPYYYQLTKKYSHKPLVYIGPSDSPYSFSAPSSIVKTRKKQKIDKEIEEGEGKDSHNNDDGNDDGKENDDRIEVALPGYFHCIWFCWLGENNKKIIDDYQRLSNPSSFSNRPLAILSSTISSLPNLAPRPKITPAERRFRKKQKKLQMIDASDHDNNSSSSSSSSSSRIYTSKPHLKIIPSTGGRHSTSNNNRKR